MLTEKVWDGSAQRRNQRSITFGMRLLALETVTRAGSLAWLQDAEPVRAAAGDPAITHGIRLPGEILSFLAAGGFAPADVDHFVVVTGPGSFTGLRVGLATIQGFALPLGRTVIGVPTLEAMTSGWIDEHRADVAAAHHAQGAVLVVCLDGARGDVFCALYDVSAVRSFEDARLLVEPFAATPVDAAARLFAAAGERHIYLTGNPTSAQRGSLHDGLKIRAVTPMPNLAASAVSLARRRPADAVHPHALRPVYVRKPDAVLARERQTDVSVALAVTSDDLADVAALQARAFDDAWGADALAGELASAGIARVYLARHGSGSVVAYCACWRIVDELHINSVAVDPAMRRRGVGKTLLRRVLEIEAGSGARAATLEVRESNRAGRALYESLGFRVEGVRRDYYQNPREDALILWRR